MTVERYHPALGVLHWLLGVLIVLGLLMGTLLAGEAAQLRPGQAR